MLLCDFQSEGKYDCVGLAVLRSYLNFDGMGSHAFFIIVYGHPQVYRPGILTAYLQFRTVKCRCQTVLI